MDRRTPCERLREVELGVPFARRTADAPRTRRRATRSNPDRVRRDEAPSATQAVELLCRRRCPRHMLARALRRTSVSTSMPTRTGFSFASSAPSQRSARASRTTHWLIREPEQFRPGGNGLLRDTTHPPWQPCEAGSAGVAMSAGTESAYSYRQNILLNALERALIVRRYGRSIDKEITAMPRRQRIHVPEGTYYVIQRGGRQTPVFARPEDYELFERLLQGVLNRTGVRLHAYCWTPDALHLALRIEDVTLGRFMQGLTSRYARDAQQRMGESGHFFRQRYQAVLIEPAHYLLPLVQYLHHLPVLEGLANSPDDHCYSSHRAYSGAADVPWLHTHEVWRLLGRSGHAYRALMAVRPAPYAAELFQRGHRETPGILGTPDFVAQLPRPVRPPCCRVSLHQIVAGVTRSLDVDRQYLLSGSRRRDLALARALIAWNATERGVASLSEVARYLRRDPSTLSVAIRRYRASRPELFKLEAFHFLTPLGRPGPYRIASRLNEGDAAGLAG